MLLASQHLQSTPLWVLLDRWDYLILPIRLRSWIQLGSLDSGINFALRMHINALLSFEHWTVNIWPLPLASGLSPCFNARQPDSQSALAFTEYQACWVHLWLHQSQNMICWLPVQGLPSTPSVYILNNQACFIFIFSFCHFLEFSFLRILTPNIP